MKMKHEMLICNLRENKFRIWVCDSCAKEEVERKNTRKRDGQVFI